MSKIMISVNGAKVVAGRATVESGDVILQAALESQGESAEVSAWKWEHRPQGGDWALKPNSTQTLTLTSATPSLSGLYRVTASSTAGEVATAEVELTVKPPTSVRDDARTSAWHTGFAVVALVMALVAVGALCVLVPLHQPNMGLKETSYAELTAGHKLAARVIGPVLLLGLAAVLVGTAMAVVEWRGTFAARPARGGSGTTRRGGLAEQITEAVKAMGGLKGASLVLTVGVLLVLAASWVAASSTAVAPEPDPAGTATTKAGTS